MVHTLNSGLSGPSACLRSSWQAGSGGSGDGGTRDDDPPPCRWVLAAAGPEDEFDAISEDPKPVPRITFKKIKVQKKIYN